MSDFRKVNDRNLVVFGIPDVEIEKEIGYIYNELERRPVAPSAAPPTIPAPFVPYVAPSSMFLDLDGLTTSPQLIATFDRQITSFQNTQFAPLIVDADDELGAGADGLWFFLGNPSDTNPPLNATYYLYDVIASYDQTSSTTAQHYPAPPISFRELLANPAPRSLGDNRLYYISNSNLFVADYDSWTNQRPLALDFNDANLGTTYYDADEREVANLPNAPDYPLITANFLYKVTISGTDYLLSSTGYAYNPATSTWSGPITNPSAGSGFANTTYECFSAAGSYMWAMDGDDLYKASASLSPTWTLVYSFGPSDPRPDFVAGYNRTVGIRPSNGELIWFNSVQVGVTSKQTQQLNGFDFSTSTRTTRNDIFNYPTGIDDIYTDTPVPTMPNEFRIVVGSTFVAVLGAIRSDYFGTMLYDRYPAFTPSGGIRPVIIPALWTITGSGGTLQTSATLLATGDYSAFVAPDPTWDTGGFENQWQRETWGGLAASGSKLYAWFGSALYEKKDSSGSIVDAKTTYQESRIVGWEIV